MGRMVLISNWDSGLAIFIFFYLSLLMYLIIL
jgi:hypothetical protein